MRSPGLAAWLAVAFLTVPAAAGEVLDFESVIRIAADSTVTVTETIVLADKQGWVQNPLQRIVTTAAELEVLEARLDGRATEFTLAPVPGGERISVGPEIVVSKRPSHTFEIVYRLRDAVSFGEAVDGFSWNVTGSGWTIPIRRARAVVHLLPGASLGEAVAEDGEAVVGGTPSAVTFTARRPLSPGEGLGLSVTWPKGFVAEPGPVERISRFMARNTDIARFVGHQPRVAGSSLAIGALAFAALLIYYLLAWHRAGRDPKPGTIVALYAPPDGLSPAAARFILKLGYDHKAFAAALLHMAVKGHVAIRGGAKRGYAVTRTGAGTAALSPDEEVVARELFAEAGVVNLAGANHEIIAEAMFAHWDKLKATHGGRYFQHNHRYLAPGLMMSALIAAVLVALAGDRENAFYASVAAVFVGLLCFAFASGAVEHWREGHRRTAIEGALFSLVSFAVAVAALGWLASSSSIAAAALLLAVFVTSLVFHFSIKAPTPEGRALMDRIAGFRHYLLVAEKERLDLLNRPEETPELFERYLPYAVALDAEQAWGAHFADALLSPLLEGLAQADEAQRPARPELVGSSLAAALDAVDRAGRSASPAPPGRRPVARR